MLTVTEQKNKYKLRLNSGHFFKILRWFNHLFSGNVKWTSLRSGRVTYLFVGHSSLYCGTFIVLYGLAFHLKLVLYLFIFNRYIAILNWDAKSIEDILRYHIISFDTLNTRKYRFSKKLFQCVTRPNLSGVPLRQLHKHFFYIITLCQTSIVVPLPNWLKWFCLFKISVMG